MAMLINYSKFHWTILTTLLFALGSLDAPVSLLIHSPIYKPEDSWESLNSNLQILRCLLFALGLSLVWLIVFNGVLAGCIKLLTTVGYLMAFLSFYSLRLSYAKNFGQLGRTIKKAGIASFCVSVLLSFLTQ